MSLRLRNLSYVLVAVGVVLPGGGASAAYTAGERSAYRFVFAPAFASAPARDRWHPTGSAPSPSEPSRGDRVARIALSEVGVPYVWGGESQSGFDCSGLVRFAYLHVGISLPHSSYALYRMGTPVSRSRLEPGDVLFFRGLGHVGLYVGGGRMVHAPQTGEAVEAVDLSEGYGASFVAARRIVAR